VDPAVVSCGGEAGAGLSTHHTFGTAAFSVVADCACDCAGSFVAQDGGVSGSVFVLSFLAVQWPFADFLMTPAARNRIFGMGYFAYFDPATILYNPYKFHLDDTPGQFWKFMAMAVVFSVITARLGFAWGDWMRRMRR